MLFSEVSSEFGLIVPPAEVEAAHVAYRDAADEVRLVIADLRTGAEDIVSEEQLAELLAETQGPEVFAAFEQLPDACEQLQAVADANGLQVDLECGSEGIE